MARKSRRGSSVETAGGSRSGGRRVLSKEDVYRLIESALAQLPRSEEPFSDGIADDIGKDQRIIFFDLPRVSPLQFNVLISLSAGRFSTRIVPSGKRAVISSNPPSFVTASRNMIT